MIRIALSILCFFFFTGMFVSPVYGQAGRVAQDSGTYGKRLCKKEGFRCFTANSADSWELLWPNPKERHLILKINRFNMALREGFVIAVPRILEGKKLMDFSPFPLVIDTLKEKILVWDPKLLAWAAYNETGTLVHWGPGVGGMDFCDDVGRSCLTPVGTFRVFRKEGPDYRSNIYPLECEDDDCASMPWFMVFRRGGYGFHGSHDVPGRHASHGCIRLFVDDAIWLSEKFVEIGTKVVIKPY